MSTKSSKFGLQLLLQPVRRLHETIRQTVAEACEHSSIETVAEVAREEEGDTIYAVDCISEQLVIDFFHDEIAPLAPIVLIAEGLPSGKLVLPLQASEEDAAWRIIVDPIDGSRGLMYQKRSGWVLTGIAPNCGPDTNLSDIQFAIQTEIPLVKQHLSDVLWAIRGEGVHSERFNRVTKQSSQITLQPSRAKTIAHGYAGISRFFPGARDELAAIDEEIVYGALGAVSPGKAHCFEDQYASSGGQLYELMSGHDRFVADIRPLLRNILNERGSPLGICCHPYDVCTELIAREAGVIVTDISGSQLNARLAVDPDVAWAGYANREIQTQIEPLLQSALTRRRLI
ncbi:MAG TPA: hypothetical protein VIF81_13800 [Pyrinomonadaceae bacterium]|jgi:fructose-1,6-bisphosphatase/inositol monophosphatase family enzyme